MSSASNDDGRGSGSQVLMAVLFNTSRTIDSDTFQTRPNTGFYVLRLGLPEGRSSEGHRASFKQVKFWPWHVEVIPGDSVVGLVTNEELCEVVWGIVIKNFMQKYSLS